MCGISGIHYRQGRVAQEALQRSAASMAHRGPDDEGFFISPDGRTGLAHRRLSFLDLSAQGRQPMEYAEQQLSVTLNGEIYNYLELRKELQARGHVFRTQTDTEVLLHGYREWGEQLPEKLEGMFAYALYDGLGKKIYLCRDRFGIKPLYYQLADHAFCFASEVKGILAFELGPRKVRPESVSLFLANRYVPAPHTLWEGIYKLRPGYWLRLDLDSHTVSETCYWKLKTGTLDLSPDEAYQRFHALLLQSLDHHLRSDVPIGAFLSGGYDSSALVYLMQKELGYHTDAFAIGFANWDQSEDRYAAMVAEATGAQLHTAKPERISMDAVRQLMVHYDDPIADISIIPTYEVSRLAAGQVKAVVSGEGADEALGGYWWHKPEKFAWRNSWRKWMGGLGGTSFADLKYHYVQAMSMGLYDASSLRAGLCGSWKDAVPDDPFAHFDSFRLPDAEPLKQLQYLDAYTFMSELILTKVDRASMAHSLEVRVPFLDHRLMEFLFSLRTTTYMQQGVQKPLLRRLLTGHVPPAILDRPKQGFVGPDQYYMDYALYRAELAQGRLVQEGVLSAAHVYQLVQRKEHWKLWKWFVLENWWRVWI